ncbi:MAG: reverse transcriptase-like protein [Solirubrobacteraceae bacterium]
MQDPKEDLLASLPTAIAPLTLERLAERSEIKRMEKRARRLANPAYVNTDAAYQDKQAGVAYASAALGDRTAVVAPSGSTEAEYLAMLMAMHDADRCLAFWPAIVFRTDSMSVATFMLAKKQKLRPLRAEIAHMLRIHPQWSLVLVKRTWNEQANQLAREALHEARRNDRATRRVVRRTQVT